MQNMPQTFVILQKSADKSGSDTSIAEDLKKSADQVKKSVEEVTGTIKRQ